ncbi:5'-nucleotidase, lipoprotein e(P4) family [Nisaea sp.]|uniref:5'-nucleotidase, lipoprotein e(P4) family n=1 Tax=Nisaea sp. TaxID=2024842 RepID=UPI003B5195C0
MQCHFRTTALASAAAAFLSFGAATTAQAEDIPAHDGLNATYWVQNAVEYKANAYALYQLATVRLDQALADTSWTAALEQTGDYQSKPPAVILDIDETVLDNSPYQAWIVEKDKYYSSKTWGPFVESQTSRVIPGSLEFTKYAKSKGVKVIYVSNRKAPGEDATRANLKKFGYPVDEDTDVVLLRGEKEEWKSSNKTPRREAVAAEYRVLLQLGDNLGDFTDENVKGSPSERLETFKKYQAMWGKQWIMFANPTYGSWEGAAINNNWRAPSSEKRAMKHAIMDEWEGPK